MLKILQARLQQYVNHGLPDVQAGIRKGRGIRDQIANIHWIIKKELGVIGSVFSSQFSSWNNRTHDGVITHLEPDILGCEVKWALESITSNKASGGGGIPVELFQILKDDAVKMLYSIYQQVWKTQQWPPDWKRSVFIAIPKKATPKNAQTTTQLHSSHSLVK